MLEGENIENAATETDVQARESLAISTAADNEPWDEAVSDIEKARKLTGPQTAAGSASNKLQSSHQELRPTQVKAGKITKRGTVRVPTYILRAKRAAASATHAKAKANSIAQNKAIAEQSGDNASQVQHTEGNIQQKTIQIPVAAWIALQADFNTLKEEHVKLEAQNKELLMELNITKAKLAQTMNKEQGVQKYPTIEETLAEKPPNKKQNTTEGTKPMETGNQALAKPPGSLTADNDHAVVDRHQQDVRQTQKPGNKNKINWADVVKQTRPQRNQLPTQLQHRVAESIAILSQGGLRRFNEPKPVAAYFTNIRRGPVGLVRKALSASLPQWALLGISFVGGSVLEIITDKRLKDRLVATLAMMNIKEIPDMNILKPTVTKKEVNADQETRKKSGLQYAQRRITKCLQTARSNAARKWYEETLAKINTELGHFGQPNTRHEAENAASDGNNTNNNATNQLTQTPSTHEQGWTLVNNKRKQTNTQTANPPRTNETKPAQNTKHGEGERKSVPQNHTDHEMSEVPQSN